MRDEAADVQRAGPVQPSADEDVRALAQFNLVEADYSWITSELLAVAADCCEGRVVSTLEGGYNLDSLANSVSAHVTAMMQS